MDIFDLLQLIGGLMLSVGYIPQVKQVVTTKSVEDLNLRTALLLFLGISLMEIYAINLVLMKTAYMLFVTNTISVFLSGLMLVLIIKYKKRR